MWWLNWLKLEKTCDPNLYRNHGVNLLSNGWDKEDLLPLSEWKHRETEGIEKQVTQVAGLLNQIGGDFIQQEVTNWAAGQEESWEFINDMDILFKMNYALALMKRTRTLSPNVFLTERQSNVSRYAENGLWKILNRNTNSESEF